MTRRSWLEETIDDPETRLTAQINEAEESLESCVTSYKIETKERTVTYSAPVITWTGAPLSARRTLKAQIKEAEGSLESCVTSRKTKTKERTEAQFVIPGGHWEELMPSASR